jgi:hypothetical protein
LNERKEEHWIRGGGAFDERRGLYYMRKGKSIV